MPGDMRPRPDACMTCPAWRQVRRWSHSPLCCCREFYEHLRDWILDTELDRYRAGRVFEYMWPLIFGEPAITAPVEECDLLRCTAEEEALAAAPTLASKRVFIDSSNNAVS